MAALSQPKDARTTAKTALQDRQRIQDPENALRRKEMALAEVTALFAFGEIDTGRIRRPAGTNDFPG